MTEFDRVAAAAIVQGALNKMQGHWPNASPATRDEITQYLANKALERSGSGWRFAFYPGPSEPTCALFRSDAPVIDDMGIEDFMARKARLDKQEEQLKREEKRLQGVAADLAMREAALVEREGHSTSIET